MFEIKEDFNIKDLIYEIRGKKVMLDSDVAYLFGYEVKQLNRQVNRNINITGLSEDEKKEAVAAISTAVANEAISSSVDV